MMNSPRGKGKKIDLEDCVTEYDIMDGDGCLIGSDLKCSLAPPTCDVDGLRRHHLSQSKPVKDLSSVHNKLFERVYDFLPCKFKLLTFI